MFIVKLTKYYDECTTVRVKSFGDYDFEISKRYFNHLLFEYNPNSDCTTEVNPDLNRVRITLLKMYDDIPTTDKRFLDWFSKEIELYHVYPFESNTSEKFEELLNSMTYPLNSILIE